MRNALGPSLLRPLVVEDLVHGLCLRVTDVVIGLLPGSILPRSIVSCAERLASEFRSRSIAIDATDDVLSVIDMNCLKKPDFSPALVLLRQALPDGS